MTNPNHYLVLDAMTTSPISVDLNQNLLEIRAIFEEKNIHHIIVQKEGKLAGIISKTDFYRASHFIGVLKNEKNELYNEKFYKTLLVEDIMTSVVETVEPTDKLEKVVAIFRKNKFHAVPVVQNDIVVGIITSYDLIVQAYESAERIVAF